MKPLAGLRVIDLTQAMAAPFCSMNLADMGADVIKVEPPTGEDMRRGSASQGGESGTFLTINRSKRGITLDLKQPAGVEVMHRLVKTADVFVQNYRPGAAQRLGVDYETLAALNPRLVYCSISGFGSTGPYAPRGGYDLIAQGMSGIISVTGDEDGPPAKAGLPVSDLSAGLFGAYGILCALEYRERTGRGQLVDTSLLEAAHGADRVGVDRVLGDRQGAEAARLRAPPGRAVPGAAGQRRLVHGGREQRQAVRGVLPGARAARPRRRPALCDGARPHAPPGRARSRRSSGRP